MKMLTTWRSLVLVAGVVATTSGFASDLKSRMDRLDRLDQMDKQQMQSHLDAAMSCISARDYACSEQRLKQAEQVAADSKDRDAVNRARKALVAEKALAAKEEAVRLAEASQLRIAEACANSCPIIREYDRCVRGLMEKFQCSYEETPQYSASSGSPNVAAEIQAALAANMAAAGRMSNTHNNMVNNINEQARQRAEREQQQLRQQQVQQQTQEQQRRQQQLAQQQQNLRTAEEQRVNAQRQRTEEAARNDQAAREREQRIAQQEQVRTPTKASAETRTQLAQASPTGRSDNATGGGRVAAAAKPSPDAEGFDESGCIESVGWCSTSQTVERKGKRQILRFTNTCPFRVYGDFINGRTGGADRGADSVRAGATHNWSTEEGDGRSFIRVIGSRSASSDWVCAGKFKNAGFAAGDSTLERR